MQDFVSQRGGLFVPDVIASTGDVAHCLNAGGMGRQDYETETMVATREVAATLTRGAESKGKGGYAGRRQEDDDNLVATPYTLAIRGRDGQPDLEYRQDGTANAILTPNGGRAGIGVGAIAIQAGAFRENPDSGPDGVGVQEGIAYTLEARAEQQAVAWSIMPQNSGKDFKARSVEVAQPLMAGGPVGGNQGGDYIQEAWAVRRLTPTECERLQGFPDGFTDINPNDKPTPDGPRYKALGNSMAVNAMRWIGRRIEMVEAITAHHSEAA